MVGNFETWDPLLVLVLKKVTECLKWNLADLPLLDTWRSKSGKVVLIGDASHATLPFVRRRNDPLILVGTRRCNGS
jgi:salicylate hydroxylase